MKNRALKFLILTITYCFAICIVTKLLIPYQTSDNYAFSQENKTASFSSKLYCSAAIHDNVAQSISQTLPTPELKKTGNDWLCSLRKEALLFTTKFYQNLVFSRNIIVLHRKQDLIYPFQYFW